MTNEKPLQICTPCAYANGAKWPTGAFSPLSLGNCPVCGDVTGITHIQSWGGHLIRKRNTEGLISHHDVKKPAKKKSVRATHAKEHQAPETIAH